MAQNWFSDFLPKDPIARRKIKRTIWCAVGVILFLQLYFVRELIVLELLFGLGFAVLFLIGLAVYALSRAGERGIDLAEPYAYKVGELTREGWNASVEAGKRGIVSARPKAHEARIFTVRLWHEMVRTADRAIEVGWPIAKKVFSKTAGLVRRGWVALEAISKKPFRHQRSESAR